MSDVKHLKNLGKYADQLERVASDVEKMEAELTTLRTRLQQVESERDKAEADAAVMREALEKSMSIHRDRLASVFDHKDASEVCLKALATNADKSLLERLKEAEWLVVNCPNSCDPEPAVFKEWWNRRDTFLNPKPQDVM